MSEADFSLESSNYKIHGNVKPTDIEVLKHIADILINYDRYDYDPHGKYGKTLSFETDSNGGYKSMVLV